jgi:endonuclease III
MDKLSQVATLETDLIEARKQVANAVKSASLAANKADDVKKLNNYLVTRLRKLEAK